MKDFHKFLKENAIPVVAIFVLATALIIGGYMAGYKQGSYESIATVSSTGEQIQADYNIFWSAAKILKENHVDAVKKTDQDFMYGAISGLAESLGDPHTVFFPPEDGKKFQEDVNGSFGGIGAEIGEGDGLIHIVAPLKDSPSEKAGIAAGDIILKIDGTPTDGLDVNKAVSLIRGQIGTSVTLNIFRKEKWVQPRDIVITRQEIELPTLDIDFYDQNRIARVQMYAFNQKLPFKFYQSATQILLRGSKGLILDLRNDPGGYLEVATNIAGWFLDRGQLIVSERFKSGPDEQLFADGNGALKDLPLVVLINRGSASASEILAGALRDQRGATIIGERSYGKGTVQELFELKDKSSLKITIAHWVMPKGQILSYDGITPDFEVLMSDDDIKNEKDPQLEKALEVLRAKLSNGSVAGR